ncbi:MAG: Ppx/GppA family phosphatase [Candidatus Schekmanbacteria bacterium]|nr:Ppx/GppA family phosphatase [Candidatus Schekmanbacteria bacterium]
MNRLAVIDVGSNTVRLLVIEGTDVRNYRVLHQAQDITRLGEGLEAGKPFLPQAQERTLSVLQNFSLKAKALGAQTIWAMGTSAMRRASNGKEFIAQVEKTCGLEFTVVSGQDEARITLQGIETALNLQGRSYLAIDIGGGSTEFILTDGQGRIQELFSLEIGAVSLTERFLKSDPPQAVECSKLLHYVQQELSAHIAKFCPAILVVGTAGTITTLAAVAQKMEKYDPKKINNYVLSRQQISAVLNNFINQPLDLRRKTPGLEPKRADIIIAGTVIILTILEILQAGELIVSDAGFREGIMVELFKKV